MSDCMQFKTVVRVTCPLQAWGGAASMGEGRVQGARARNYIVYAREDQGRGGRGGRGMIGHGSTRRGGGNGAVDKEKGGERGANGIRI